MRYLLVFALSLLLAFPAAADFSAGRRAYDAGDWVAAIGTLRPLAEQGDARAAVLLGNMYANGYGVAEDMAEAFALYRRAALSGIPEAMLLVAAQYQQGLGVAPDIRKALGWYERAAAAGQARGAFFAAGHYYQGLGGIEEPLPRDLPAAYRWFLITQKLPADAALHKAAAVAAEKLKAMIEPAAAAAAEQAAEAFTLRAAAGLPALPENLRTP